MTLAGSVLEGERTLVLRRVFQAPRPLVYRLWTEPEFVAEWWGVEGATNPVCELDVRPGGAWRIHMRVSSGTVYRNEGVFREVVENVRLVYTHEPEPEHPAWKGTAPEPTVHTVGFEDAEGGTRVTLTVEFASETHRDLMLSLGVQRGLSQGHDRLERLIAVLSKQESQRT